VSETVINTLRGPDGGVVVEVRGEVDVASAQRLRDVLHDVASRLRPTAITVDLLHVTFIDSTGLGALVAGLDAAHDIGAEYQVRNANPRVHGRLAMTGLLAILNYALSEHESESS